MPSLFSTHGRFDFPPPTSWPAEALRTFAKVTGARSLFDVFVFNHECAGTLYMEDALLALSVLPITPSEWSTHLGYPQVSFEPWKMEQYVRGLTEAGYRVQVMEKCSRPETEGNGKVVSIAIGRTAVSRRRYQWA